MILQAIAVPADRREKNTVLGVLDIYGFEIFAENGSVLLFSHPRSSRGDF
jgi:myosin heavy subunit